MKHETTKYKTREEWLGAAVELLRPVFVKRAGVTLPDAWRVSCGFPRNSRGGAIGQCWAQSASRDGHWEMFISPVLAEPARVLGVLVHELIHAGIGIKHGHNKVFGKAARARLLEGKLTATTEGKPFKDEIAAPVLAKLGVYPHGELRPSGEGTGPRKQATRLLKAACGGCGYCVRITQKWLDIAPPTCPNPGCDEFGETLNHDGA